MRGEIAKPCFGPPSLPATKRERFAQGGDATSNPRLLCGSMDRFASLAMTLVSLPAPRMRGIQYAAAPVVDWDVSVYWITRFRMMT